jgi:hypothetical protein
MSARRASSTGARVERSGKRRRAPRSASMRLDAEPLQSVVERRALHPERARHLGLVAAAARERERSARALDVFELLVEIDPGAGGLRPGRGRGARGRDGRPPARGARRSAGVARPETRGARLDHVAAREDRGALDHVLQLAHVAREVVGGASARPRPRGSRRGARVSAARTCGGSARRAIGCRPCGAERGTESGTPRGFESELGQARPPRPTRARPGVSAIRRRARRPGLGSVPPTRSTSRR